MILNRGRGKTRWFVSGGLDRNLSGIAFPKAPSIDDLPPVTGKLHQPGYLLNG
jgi:hypothetical protein